MVFVLGQEGSMRKFMLFLIAAGATGAAMLAQVGAVSADDLRAPGGGTIRALVVGVDVYSRLDSEWQLQGARADAEDIAAALSQDGVKPVVLLDADATRAKIVAQMDSFVADSRPGDLVLFAFAGHGMQIPEYPRWQGIDANGVNEQIVLSGFNYSGAGADEIIVNPEMRAWLSRLDAKGVDTLVIVDSCFGGGMREVDPRTRAMRTRVLRASADEIRAGESGREQFVGIPMTDKEARASVALMPHVTFLAGATSKSVVPETDGLVPGGQRGALSYFLARALRGDSAKDGVVTRRALYDYLKPNVRHATEDRQLIQVEPQSPDPSVYGKPVFKFASALPSPEPPKLRGFSPADTPRQEAVDARADAVSVAMIDGAEDRWGTIEKGNALFTRSPTVDDADLVWDVAKSEALSRGDLVMQFVDGSLMGGVIDRTWVVKRLREIAENRNLPMRLASEGQLLTSGDQARVEIDEIADQHLVVFNVAADATVQMLYPSAPGVTAHCPNPENSEWHCSLGVTPPFGADTIVALAASGPADDLLGWLREHHDKRDAALVPELLTTALKTDPTARVGFVGVFTNKRQ
jgi:hypothetical protein